MLEELKPQFERATQHTLAITFGTAVPLKRQIEAGETFDVVILTPALIEDLVYVVFTAGISPQARDAGAARAFIKFLTAPAALPVLKAKGMEPG